MITIEINERTQAGKALLQAARIMAQKNEGIEITKENSILITKIKRNHQKKILSEAEKANFLEELRNEL
jgi:sulfite reductase beta subunit-like hemoprotein